MIRSITASGITGLSAFGWAAGILPWLAEEIRRYLVGGSPATLAAVGLSSAAGLCALTVAWLVPAGQRVPQSLRSAGLTATLTAPYALALTALGGWVIG